MLDDKIDLANLKIIVNYAYEFKAKTPGVLNDEKLAEYTVEFPNGLPAGELIFSVYENSLGFLLPPVEIGIKDAQGALTPEFKLKMPLSITKIESMTNTDSSFMGGVISQINGKNFNNLITDIDTKIDLVKTESKQKVLICGFPADIIEAKSSFIKFFTPEILTTQNPNWLEDLENLNGIHLLIRKEQKIVY